MDLDLSAIDSVCKEKANDANKPPLLFEKYLQ